MTKKITRNMPPWHSDRTCQPAAASTAIVMSIVTAAYKERYLTEFPPRDQATTTED